MTYHIRLDGTQRQMKRETCSDENTHLKRDIDRTTHRHIQTYTLTDTHIYTHKSHRNMNTDAQTQKLTLTVQPHTKTST